MITIIKNAIENFARKMSRHSYGRAKWTECLLDCLIDVGHRAGCEIACSSDRADSPEWLYDMTWLSFDTTRQKRLLKVDLALESEWDPDYAAIMKDFSKLIQSRAKIKVMVCSNCGYDFPRLFQEAVACYPGVEECSYLFAVCNFGNAASPVSVSICDEKGQLRVTGRFGALQRYLRSTDEATVKLQFDGFWPNIKRGFIADRPGFYFVFAGVRKKTQTGFVAELHRLLLIATTSDIQNLASGDNNAFEQNCSAGEIPYFAFAEVQSDSMSVERVLASLIYHFRPQMMGTRIEPVQSGRPLRILMTGAVAECLGPRDFLV